MEGTNRWSNIVTNSKNLSDVLVSHLQHLHTFWRNWNKDKILDWRCYSATNLPWTEVEYISENWQCSSLGMTTLKREKLLSFNLIWSKYSRDKITLSCKFCDYLIVLSWFFSLSTILWRLPLLPGLGALVLAAPCFVF